MPRRKAPTQKTAVMKRCVFYVDAETYCVLRARMLRRGTNVTAWIRDCIAVELSKQDK